jgi:hypothetical protein
MAVSTWGNATTRRGGSDEKEARWKDRDGRAREVSRRKWIVWRPRGRRDHLPVSLYQSHMSAWGHVGGLRRFRTVSSAISWPVFWGRHVRFFCEELVAAIIYSDWPWISYFFSGVVRRAHVWAWTYGYQTMGLTVVVFSHYSVLQQ